MSYLDELNEAQRRAVENTEGPSIVLAGAGSGKTRVLTYRIAHLLKKGVDPFNILSLTFTNKAAREMKSRIVSMVGDSDAQNLWMGTFHSVFAKILRYEHDRIGYPANFTIYDTSDSKNLIKTIVREEGLDEKVYSPAAVLNRISNAKTNLITWVEYQQNAEFMNEDKLSKKPQIGRLYELYVKRCFRAWAMDFDDLLFNTHYLLNNNPDILAKYQRRFRFILVDEYQDTNYVQYIILKMLAALNENICVVGDDAQSIYAFRGANIQNILSFQSDYSDAKMFKLEQNYRSTQNIVNAANSVIANNMAQIRKNVWTENEDGNRVKVLRALSDTDEGNQVANAIFDAKMQNQMRNADFAILYRTNAQSRAMEEALRRLNIPYRIYGGLSFYQRKEIKDLLAYFRLVVNPNDEDALVRIINLPARGIGQTSIDRIVVRANEMESSVWQVVDNIQNIQIDVSSGIRHKVVDFAMMIKSFSAMLRTKNAYELAVTIAGNSKLLKELYDDKSPEGVSRYENVEELLNAIKDFVETNQSEEGPLVSLDAFMQDIALLTGEDHNDDPEDKDRVSLMTIHSAKGLEFPHVFIVGVEENLFPSQLTLTSRTELEEERRLFYVAITRAEKNLTISYANTRYRWGNLTSCEPSRFIEEIDKKYLDLPETQAPRSFATSWKPNVKPGELKASAPLLPKKMVKVSTTIENDPKKAHYLSQEKFFEVQTGMVVEHERFGRGKVLDVEGQDADKKATVFFEGVGQKQLLLKFAKLKIIS